MKFTDKFLQNIKPKDKRYWVAEGQGFQLLVLPSGTRTFYIRYTFNGKQKEHKLGQYRADISSLSSKIKSINCCRVSP
jgi:hypothetical protein